MQELDASVVAAQFLRGLRYPIAPAEILSAAHEANLADEIVAQLARMPDREYVDRDDLTGALNAAG